MTDIQRLIERQAQWQKSRRSLSWPEKVRMAEAMRGAIHQLRGGLNKKSRARTEPQSGREA